tara:strand:+ start:1155 stop:1610 length:456 start_codon:yes stop_codon:yes gene_type:complete
MHGLYTKEQRRKMTKINGKDKGYTCTMGILDMDGFRTWWLEAKYNNIVIHRFDKSQSDNYTKYLKFLIGLRKKNYDLSYDDMTFYKSDGFIKEKYKKYVTRDDLINAAALVNYNEEYLVNLKNQLEEEKEMFCWHMGIDMDELGKIMVKFR